MKDLRLHDRAVAALLQAVVFLCLCAESPAKDIFTEVSPNVFLFRDTCNAYLIRCGDRGIAIDCGDAKMLEYISQVGVKQIDWVLFTHHHRDQCQRAAAMLEHGAKIAVPQGEEQFFSRVEEFWQTEQIYKRVRFKPDFFVLRQSIPKIDKVFNDGDVLSVDDLQIEAVNTPGHTPGQASYIVTVSGRKIVFSGDLIYSPGKIWNFYSLQYQYDDCGKRGAQETLASLDKLIAKKPDLVLPSHGEPITDLDSAANELKPNLTAVVGYFGRRSRPEPNRVSPPDWLLVYEDLASDRWFQTYAMVDKEGNAFVVDPVGHQVAQDIIRDKRIKNVDFVWLSHYHFDHVEGANELKEHYGAKLYAHEKLADVLEHPLAYSLPCLVEEPIKVDRPMKHGEKFSWRGIDFTAYDFPSQTWWHDGLLAVVDGRKYFFSGDGLYNPRYPQSDNCRNYCPIEENDGAIFSARLLKEVNPEFLITGHWDVWRVTPDDFDALIAYAEKIRPLAEKLIAQPEINMGMDEQWASFYPYRTKTTPGAEIPLAVRLRNHLAQSAKATVSLRCPAGWMAASDSQNAQIEKKSAGQLDFKISIPREISAGRYIITANVTFADTNYGELAEAIVDVQ